MINCAKTTYFVLYQLRQNFSRKFWKIHEFKKGFRKKTPRFSKQNNENLSFLDKFFLRHLRSMWPIRAGSGASMLHRAKIFVLSFFRHDFWQTSPCYRTIHTSSTPRTFGAVNKWARISISKAYLTRPEPPPPLDWRYQLQTLRITGYYLRVGIIIDFNHFPAIPYKDADRISLQTIDFIGC